MFHYPTKADKYQFTKTANSLIYSFLCYNMKNAEKKTKENVVMIFFLPILKCLKYFERSKD